MNNAPSSVFHCIFQRHDMQLKPHPRDLEWELDNLSEAHLCGSPQLLPSSSAHISHPDAQSPVLSKPLCTFMYPHLSFHL